MGQALAGVSQMNETQPDPDFQAHQPGWGPSPCEEHELGSTTGSHAEGIHPMPLTHSPVLDIPQINSHFLKADDGQTLCGMCENSPPQEHIRHRSLP